MTTFVLVHGAWQGGWVWRKVAQRLRAGGHLVFTPTLTGLCERAHLASADVDLQTHIQDVVGLIETEDLTDVLLVGHSYAGMVITGVADRVAERLQGLVYLDAFIPESGASMESLAVPGRFEALKQKAVDAGDPNMTPPPEASFWSIKDPEDEAWLDRRTTAHPLGTYTQKLDYTVKLEEVGSLTYVLAEINALGQFDKFADYARQNPAWHVETVPCGHEAMVDEPQKLNDILVDAAQQ